MIGNWLNDFRLYLLKMDSIEIDIGFITHLRSEPKICAVCGVNDSKWQLQGDVQICSLCTLYCTRWGEINKKKLETFIGKVEDSLGSVFEKREGRLANFSDADRIVSAIVLENMVFRSISRFR